MIEKASSNGHGVGVRSEPLKAAREADREAPAPTRAPQRKAAIAFGALALVLVAAVGVGYSLHASGYESTDDAFIEDLYNLIRNIHGSVEISLVTALIARRAQVHQAMLAAHVAPYDVAATQQLQALQRAYSVGATGVAAARHAMAALYAIVVK